MKKIIYILLIFFLNFNSFALENIKLNEITEGNETAKIKMAGQFETSKSTVKHGRVGDLGALRRRAINSYGAASS